MSVNRQVLDLQDTIFALASGPLPSAVAILRLSGPQAFAFAETHFHPASGAFRRERGMLFGDCVDSHGAFIDSVLLLSFVAPRSFTGQDVIEIQCHGSLAVVHRIKRLALEMGARPAERGEFSWRAFQSGRLSASDLETLGDVFIARDVADLDRIYRRKDDSITQEVESIRADLIRLQAILDTAVDFSEEYAHVTAAARLPIDAARMKAVGMAGRFEVFGQGQSVPRLVLAGRPNAGKSSLFNALLCRYRAIVNEKEGTTRDVIEEDVELAGRRWKLVDTAGLRTAETETERLGIELGADFLEGASFWILVVDGVQGLSAPEKDLLSRFGGKPHLVVWNKKDLPGFLPPPAGEKSVAVSALTGDAIQELSAVLQDHAKAECTEGVLPTATQAKRLRRAVERLDELSSDLDKGVTPEILGEKNRVLLRGLEDLVGEVGVEDVLDRVFSEFCIGK